MLEVPCHEKDVLRKEWEFEICGETHSKAQKRYQVVFVPLYYLN